MPALRAATVPAEFLNVYLNGLIARSIFIGLKLRRGHRAPDQILERMLEKMQWLSVEPISAYGDELPARFPRRICLRLGGCRIANGRQQGGCDHKSLKHSRHAREW